MSEQDPDELNWPMVEDDDLALVPVALAKAACGPLDLDSAARERLSLSLRSIAVNYLIDQSLEPFYDDPGEAKPALKRFLRSNAPLADFVAPEYVVTIEALAEQLRQAAIAQHHSSREQPLEIFVRRAATIFLAEYRPTKGRPTNLPLEHAVRSLVKVLKHHTGRLPEVSLNKNNERQPELRSPEAQVIGLLLRGIDPKLPEPAIVNMIEKVKRSPRESEHLLQAIFRGNPVAELDASLLTGREAAIQETLAKLL